jgi:ribonuclease HII
VKYVIGIDEVGRGPLAGPVVLAAVCIPNGLRIQTKIGKLKDCKKLLPKKREEWANYLRAHPKVKYALSRIYPRGIEKLNISQAANRAAYKACMRLISQNKLRFGEFKILLDGGLYPRSEKVTLLSQTVVRGDEKFTAIKIASIFAKVERDKYLVKLSKVYPQYGFEEHKGYATVRHRKALRKYGPTEIHRLTFLGKYSKMKKI